MADKLKEIFRAYVETLQSNLQKRSKGSTEKRPLKLYSNGALELQTSVEEAESEAVFLRLTSETRSLFSGDFHGKNESAWRSAMGNFFRRAGYYVDLFEGKTPDEEILFSRYCDVFQRREKQVTYLVPLEFVYFSKESMDFGSFQVRRFTSDELETILQKRVNSVFYRWAAVDVKQLCNYWFVYVTEGSSIPRLGRIYLPWEALGRVKIEYSRYPKVVTDALQALALFDWQANWWRNSSPAQQPQEDLEKGWLGFKIPFVLRVDDNWLGSPSGAPDLARLDTEPVIDPATGEIGEEEVPTTHIHLDKRETELFQDSVQQVEKLLTNLKVQQHPWPFIDIALGYFIKAFFTEGLEQLLWHLTTLEALVGEKGEGVTERLAQRVSAILGKSENERKALKKQFKGLYSFRSDLVHGNQFQEQVFAGHLREARDLARRTLFWFLHYLDHIQVSSLNGQPVENIPSREEILLLLDMNERSRGRLSRLIEKLPTGFPNVSEWMG